MIGRPRQKSVREDAPDRITMSEEERLGRRIVHVDMDAFYAAVEELDNPALKGIPMAVGGSPEGRGVITTANYIARGFGVGAGMPAAKALKLCPNLTLIRGNHDRYSEISGQIMEIFRDYSPLVQPISCDEAWIDLTGTERLLGPVEHTVQEIRNRIRTEVGITGSAGLSTSKFVAKIASDLDKPDGFINVPAGREREFLEPLEIKRMWGIGKATLPKFLSLNIRTFGDLIRLPAKTLKELFGDWGLGLQKLASGVDLRPVSSGTGAISASHETTFAEDVPDGDFLRAVLLRLCEKVSSRVRRYGMKGRVVQLKVRFDDFHTITRRLTLHTPSSCSKVLYESITHLLETRVDLSHGKIRLIGVGFHHLAWSDQAQLSLFGDDEKRVESAERAVDKVRGKFGDESVVRGSLLGFGRRMKRPKDDSG